MADLPHEQESGRNPLTLVVGMGAGVAILIAIGIAMTEGPSGSQVGVAESPTQTSIEATVPADIPQNADIVEPVSGRNATPADTDEFTTAIPAGSDTNTSAETETPAGVDPQPVVDPDEGAKQRGTTEGDMGSFYPTVSGPEGRDGDPFTTE
ncbi:hypothetical protein SAMN04488515_2690 [Cognatiyoonia koreensis]|uniref:Uncharacterized protein n=1 Tax=Cognatiyoonia koreensis TaxID=364200 RepID=A0A1I0RHA7_9RHOB|nr:hypothetical protein [Cognatiyoonia koreensis]SEW40269.1 hypothetical protein SAMN04488515_2690 [Cognatiyoonia koreensis]